MTDAVADVRSLVVTYGGVPVNLPVSFHLRRGQLGLIIGSNGSGKTSIIRALIGQAICLSGTVCLAGMVPRPGRSWLAARSGVAVVPQFPVLPSFLSVEEYLCLWHSRRRALSGERHESDESGTASSMTSVCDRVGITVGSNIGTLSFGQRRLLELALAVDARPVVLLVDEPLAGVAPSRIPLVVESVRQLLSAGGAVLMAMHETEMSVWESDWIVEVRAQ